MSSINFDNPWLLLIALPVAILLLVPFFLTVRKDNRNVHNVTSCILHLLIAVMVGFSAAGTSIQSVLTETNVYVVADLSYSTHKNLEVIDGHIRSLEDNLPLHTELGVVCFGATDSQVVHTRLGEKPQSVASAVEEIDYTSTDAASALRYVGKIFKKNVVKRIVLITDGKESNQIDEGALKRTVDNLRASNVYVDAIYLDSNLSAAQAEVQISAVDYTQRVYQNQEATANVYLQSTTQTRTTLNLYCNEELVSTQPIDVGVGMRSVPLRLKTEETGEFRYRVTLSDTEQDGSHFNDVQLFTQTVASQAKMLFITDSYADEELVREIYGESFLDAVDVRYVGQEIPYTVAGLCAYDEIVLSNVDVSKIRNYEMFVESLETVVSLLGKSLIGMGDLHLQNTTDDALKRLADMMPVTYGDPISREKLYAIVLDISNSMNQSSRFALAKSAAKQLVDLLQDEDMVTVLGFYGEAEIIQPVTKARDRKTIKEKIDAAADKHGTVMKGGLQGAKTLIQSYAERMPTQIFLITDGTADDNADWQEAGNIAAELNLKYDVVTSVLGIVPKTMTKINQLAKSGKGSAWNVRTNADLNDVALADISSDLGDVVVNRNVYVDKATLYDDVLEKVDDTSYIRGYLTSSNENKPNATNVLTAEHQRLNTATVTVPIYSYWDYGNGRAASFTSTFTGKWLQKWQEKGIDKQFFKNVFSVNVPKERIDAPFVATLSQQAGGANLEVRPAQLKADGVVDVRVLSPEGEESQISNLALDSNVYRCAFTLPSVGEYKVEITYTYKGDSYTTTKSVSVSYLAEYDAFAIFDAAPLYQALGEKGTVSEDGNLTIVNDESEVGVRIIDLTLPLLIACVVLFAADIIVRKLKWADIKGIFRNVNKGGKV